jgi:predicted permease
MSRWLHKTAAWIKSQFHRKELDQELDAELRSHLALVTDQKIAEGMKPEEARRAAQIELGGVEQVKEAVRAAKVGAWLDTVLQDLRFGLRILRKSPGFAAVAILTLALGIGANTAVFSMINGLMLRTLPVRHPEQLVELLHQYPGEPAFNGFSWDAYRVLRNGNRVFSHLIVGSLNSYVVSSDDLQPQTVFGGCVGGTFFKALGIGPAAGRLIGEADVRMEDPTPIAVVSWSFWKSRFNLDPAIVGKKLVVNDAPVTIIGVTQRGFYGLSEQARQDIWLPLSMERILNHQAMLGWGAVGLLGRLKPGVSIDEARAQMAVLFQTAVQKAGVGPFVRKMRLRIEPAGDGISTPLRQMLSAPLFVLMGLVGLLLLLACANLAGLMLVRSASRRQEIAVRVCLGAGRSRLLRQTITESMLLSVAGSAVGVFLAYFGVRALARVFVSGRAIVGLPVHLESLAKPDEHVLLFTAAVALSTGLLFGIAPAVRACGTAPASALQRGSGIGEPKSQRFFGRGLVISQVALSLVLLSSAVLFAGYLSRLGKLNLGFSRKNLLLVTFDPAHSGYTPARFSRAAQGLITQLVAIPGVRSATLSAMTPMQGPGESSFAFAEGHPEAQHGVSINDIAPDYFKTFDTPFLAGRDFSPQDQNGSPVAIINDAAARDCFGHQSPIGRHITLSHVTLTKGEKTYEVVGVVGDAKYNDIQQPDPPTIYRDAFQNGFGFVISQLSVQSKIDPYAVARPVRETVSAALKTMPIVRVTTMEAQINSSIVPQRLIARLSGLFGVLGAMLAAIGLYGLLAYRVARRTPEIGLRMALGATRGNVSRMVLRDAVWMLCGGLLLGVPLAFWAKKLAASVIPDLAANTSLPILLGGAAIIVVALIAAYIPVRQAMRVDPAVALRHE